ncbi:DUF3592 domain-containing protein [Knoellia sp. S7-12]|uniref:DUF3592 domain-containing protein n=1 Tax=Knoellia sp. S7-12 TaxID=3126698 RepID=UPI00336601B4
MNRRLGPVGSLVCSLFCLLAGGAFVVNALVVQQALRERGVVAAADVIALNEDWGRLSEDSVDVRLVEAEYTEPISLTRYEFEAEVGDRIEILYDASDPSTAVQQGVGVWGFYETLMLGLGFAGLAGTVHATYQLIMRPRRRPFPTPVRPAFDSTDPGSWVKKGARRRRK